jgi:hypothetical protein
MQMNKDGNTQGVSLYVTLSKADADLLRAAVPAGVPSRDALGIKETTTLAQMALGAVCRAILRQGYQPRPLSAELRLAGTQDQEPLPPGVIQLQFAHKEAA